MRISDKVQIGCKLLNYEAYDTNGGELIMAKEQKTQVESIYKSKEEKVLAELFQMKVAQLICKKPNKTGIKYIMKN